MSFATALNISTWSSSSTLPNSCFNQVANFRPRFDEPRPSISRMLKPLNKRALDVLQSSQINLCEWGSVPLKSWYKGKSKPFFLNVQPKWPLRLGPRLKSFLTRKSAPKMNTIAHVVLTQHYAAANCYCSQLLVETETRRQTNKNCKLSNEESKNGAEALTSNFSLSFCANAKYRHYKLAEEKF